MNSSYLRLAIGGVLFGLAIYFVPFFILGVFGFFIFFRLMGWLFWGPRRHRRYQYAWAYADRIRTMSDEEYDRFKQERHTCGHRWSNQNRQGHE